MRCLTGFEEVGTPDHVVGIELVGDFTAPTDRLFSQVTIAGWLSSQGLASTLPEFRLNRRIRALSRSRRQV